MFILPFIYFSLLTFYFYKKQEGVTVCVYMSALYAFTAMCAIINVLCGYLGEDGGILFSNTTAEFGFLPTIVYCGVLTATLWPFSRFNTTKIKTDTLINGWALDIFSIFLICLFLLNIYLVADSTMDILNGNFADVRKSMEEGEESLAQIKAQSLPFMLSYIYLLNVGTIFALPIAFYNFAKHRRPWWFNCMLIVTSISQPIAAIQTADRTEVAFWGLMVAFTLVMFWRNISTKVKIGLGIASLPIVVAMAIYVSAVSNDRFEKSYGGPMVSIMQYVGQNYINFCYFWENANPDYIATEREFPLLNRVTTGIVNEKDRRMERAGQHGFYIISVFPSFIGDIYLDLSLVGMLLWVMAFVFICMRVIPDTEDPDTEVKAGDYLTVFLLGIIPTFGIFYYKYHVFKYTLVNILVVILIIILKNSFSSTPEIEQDEDSSDSSDL